MTTTTRNKKNKLKRSTVIWILLAIGFCAMEFPGILFFKSKVYPFIFGMPFIYGYTILCWMFFVVVLFYAWRTRWGKIAFFKKNRV